MIQKTEPPTTSRNEALLQLAAAVGRARESEGAGATLRAYLEAGALKRLQGAVGAGTASRRESLLMGRNGDGGIILPELGNVPLREITYARIEEARAAWKAQGYSVAYRNIAARFVARILHDAASQGVLMVSPLKPPRGQALEERTEALALELSDDERRRLLAAFQDEQAFRGAVAKERDEGAPRANGRGVGGRLPASAATTKAWSAFRAAGDLVLVAVETGIPRGDLLALKWSSVDLDAGVIRYSRIKTGVRARPPITAACREVLLRRKGKRTGEDLVFLSEAGKPFGETMLVRYFEHAKALARIERRVRFHDLRHTFGCRLGRRGMNAFEIADAMGHADIATTAKYVRMDGSSADRLRAALEA